MPGNYVTERAAKLKKRIVEAKHHKLLTLNQDDINKAKVKDSKNCAFACAVKRQVPGAEAAYFFKSTAYIEFYNKFEKFALPVSVQKEIVAFDRGAPASAGVYSLNVPKSAHYLKAYRARNKKRGKRTSRTNADGSRRLRHVTENVRDLLDPDAKK